MKTYRAVALYMQDAEVAEGYGSSRKAAIADAKEQIGPMYPLDDITFQIHVETL